MNATVGNTITSVTLDALPSLGAWDGHDPDRGLPAVGSAIGSHVPQELAAINSVSLRGTFWRRLVSQAVGSVEFVPILLIGDFRISTRRRQCTCVA
jgi:hypothetical protein